ncbi:MAG: hypothetical protein H8E31_02455, partial [Planctomycetes bacterium]|nr:hypothetical protein [Planctomycetota bacterium]
MSYRLLRFLIVLIGLSALGGFGWRFYDFLQRRAELLGPFPLAVFKESIPVESDQDNRIHLKEFPEYALLRTLNVTGILPPPEPGSGGPVVVAPPLVGPNDLRLVFLSLGALPQVYLTPAVPQPANQTTGRVSGGLYTVGDRFSLPTKEGVELEILAIRADEVEIGIVGKEDGAFVLRREVATASISQIQAGAGASVVPHQFPARTTAVGGDLYEVGTDDLAELEAMSEDQLLQSVRTQPKYGDDGTAVGQRVTSLGADSPLQRFGLRENDVVLDINGVPAGDRPAPGPRVRPPGAVGAGTGRPGRVLTRAHP